MTTALNLPARPRSGRARRIVTIGLAVTLLAGVAGAIGWQRWRQPAAQDPHLALAASAARMAALSAARFDLTYTDVRGQRVTGTFTVTREGQVAGTVQDVGAGRAEIRAGSGGTIVKGDEAWWSRRDPQRLSELVNRWVKPASGLAFGVHVAKMLRFDHLADIQRQASKADPSWKPLGRIGGEEQFLVRGGNWTFRYAAGNPPRLIGMSSSRNSQVPVPVSRPAEESKPSRGEAGFAVRPAAYSAAQQALAREGAPSAVFHPSIDLQVAKPPTEQQVRHTRQAVPNGTSAAEGGKSAKDSKVLPQAKALPPALLISQFISPSHCSVPICTHIAQVRNIGGRTSSLATAVLTAAPGGMATVQVPPLPPGGSANVSLSHPNPAKGGMTLTGTSFVSVQQLGAGASEAVLDTLHHRLGSQVMTEPVLTSLDAPLLGQVHQTLEVLSRGAYTDVVGGGDPYTDPFIVNGLGAVKFAAEQQLLPELTAIAGAKKLKNPDGVARNVMEMKRAYDSGDPNYLGQLRQLQDVALQARLHPNANLVYDDVYVIDGKKFKADRFLEDPDSGKREAVQSKSLRNIRNFPTYLRDAIEQLNGEKGPDEYGNVEIAPEWFTRIALMYVENPAGIPGAAPGAKASIAEQARWADRDFYARKLAKLHRDDRTTFCGEGGKFRLDKVIVVNNAGVHELPLKDIDISC